MRAWWEEDEERRCQFYRDIVGCNDIPPSRCTTDVAYYIIHQHIQAPSMWAIFPLQVLTETLFGINLYFASIHVGQLCLLC